jgi:hypothetical protein
MKRYWLLLTIILILIILVNIQFRCTSLTSETVESYIEIELNRLQETYRLLDRFAQDIWPGWDNFQGIAIHVKFPNNVQLLVTPHTEESSEYEQIQGRTIFDKFIFINRKEKIPEEIRPPLLARQGRGGLLIQLVMDQPKLPPEEPERSEKLEAVLKAKGDKNTAFNLEPQGDSDSHILMYIHEHFHGFQSQFRHLGSGEGLRDFEVNAEYAAYSHIEGLALLQAFEQKDNIKSLEYLKDFIVAREIKHTYMPPEAIPAEQFISLIQGTASYASLKMAVLIRDRSYKPKINQEVDPYFYNFDYVDEYLENIMKKGLNFVAEWTLDKRGKYYLYGAYQCFLLDRFIAGWKQDFFQEKKNLDDITSDFLNLSKAEKMEITERLKSKYSFVDIYTKHKSIIEKAKQKR